ncbi:WD40-repeat-containing domain protein [Phlyctochytrium arcticum]|nr:WD40-repeat-containing domain protein [Phlyctochytrium arcticum]
MPLPNTQEERATHDEGIEDISTLSNQILKLSEEERAELAYQLLLSVSGSSLSYITNRIAPRLLRDFVTHLPHEVAVQILVYTDAKTVGRAARVSKGWRAVAGDNVLWSMLYTWQGWGSGISQLARSELAREQTDDVFRKERKRRRQRYLLALQRPDLYDVDQNNDERVIRTSDRDEGVGEGIGNDWGTAGSPEGLPGFGHETDSDSEIGDDVAEPQAAAPLSEGSAQASDADDAAVSLIRAFNNLAASTPEHAVQQSVSCLPISNTPDNHSSISSTDQKVPHCQCIGFGDSCTDCRKGSTGGQELLVIDWKRVYRHRKRLERNWAEGRYTTRVYAGHEEAVYCLQCTGQSIFSGSRDRTIKVWDTVSGACTATLRGHLGSVLCLQFIDPYLISGSSDATICIWELGSEINDESPLHILRGHTESVLNLCFSVADDIIVSCSKDTTVRIWQLSTAECLQILSGHRATVNAVQYAKGLVVSASGDRQIKVWDVRSGEQIRKLVGHTRGIASLHFDGDIVVSGSSGGFRTFDGHARFG